MRITLGIRRVAREPYSSPKLKILDEGRQLHGVNRLAGSAIPEYKAGALSIPRKDRGRCSRVG
jgi:hypothetical protein